MKKKVLFFTLLAGLLLNVFGHAGNNVGSEIHPQLINQNSSSTIDAQGKLDSLSILGEIHPPL